MLVSKCCGAEIKIKTEKVYVPAFKEEFITKEYCIKCHKPCEVEEKEKRDEST